MQLLAILYFTPTLEEVQAMENHLLIPLHHNYPGEDYQDVMDGVDLLIKKGWAHEDQLYVTGGSAGGIMTAWMIGKSSRFEAAVVVKPVMNWISKTLVADNYFNYANTRFPRATLGKLSRLLGIFTFVIGRQYRNTYNGNGWNGGLKNSTERSQTALSRS